MTEVHPIEAQSYAIMRSRIDLSRWASPQREIVERMIHSSADESFLASTRIGASALDAAVAALRSGAAVVCDSNMVLAGVRSIVDLTTPCCHLGAGNAPGATATPETPAEAAEAVGSLPPTRSAAAVDDAAACHRDGALWVIGNAPTALWRLLRLAEAGEVEPAAVIGLPVGYVGAAESKAALWESRLAEVSITNTGRRGGSPVAAAAVNALARIARRVDQPDR